MKKNAKHIILYPLSLLYGLATGLRNWLFDIDILPSTTFHIPIISVGNLAVGGTGKTPHTEFIIAKLQKELKIAILSRGYKRETKGFILADEKSSSIQIGDEPYQIHQKFPGVTVAVDEKRVNGTNKLLSLVPDLQLIVLDDAFQHRYIQAGLSILLTDYSNLYTRDCLLPAGNLREWNAGSKRANIIVVTKCPTDIHPIDMRLIELELKPENNQLLFFSNYVYDQIQPIFKDISTENWTLERVKELNASILLVAGIVSPEPILHFLSGYSTKVESLFFDDHHAFQAKDFILIDEMLNAELSSDKIIVVTEKDAARLLSNPNYPEALKSKTFALPIRVEILNKQETSFIDKIQNYVTENSRNS